MRILFSRLSLKTKSFHFKRKYDTKVGSHHGQMSSKQIILYKDNMKNTVKIYLSDNRVYNIVPGIT